MDKPTGPDNRSFTSGSNQGVVLRQVKPPASGWLRVDRGQATCLAVPHGEFAHVFAPTLSDGSIGIAGLAWAQRVRLAFIAHINEVTGDELLRKSSYLLPQFATMALRRYMASRVEMHVIYDAAAKSSPDYGQRQGEPTTWHYLDRLEVVTQRLTAIFPRTNIRLEACSQPANYTLSASVFTDSEPRMDFGRISETYQ